MIRAYKESDINGLIDVWYRASKIAHFFLSEDFLKKERAHIKEKYLPVTYTWVYEENGKILGFISVIEDVVGALFVDPGHQRKNIGSALMDFVCTLLPEIKLDVFKKNKIGRAFYEKYGLEYINEYVHEETGEIMLRMRFTRAKLFTE